MKKIFILLSFISVLTSSMSAQVFDYVVAQDNSGDFTTLQAAIDACPDNERKIIFIKPGTYNEKIMIGSHSKVSNKLLSLIGEDAETVIITWDDYNGKEIVYDGKTVKSGTPQSATFTVNAADFYAENLTIVNTYTEKQAVALYNVADRQTFKNCNIIGYQDTHYLKKGRRSYFQDSYIEGATDYVCAGGTAIFENCTLNSIRDGSYISAPEDISAITTVGDKKYYYGFVFRNCVLTSDNNSVVYLGRPWQEKSSSVFISCQMENIKPEGWSTWSNNNHETAFFAEYNSFDANDNPIDISKRVDWSYQLTKEEVDTYYTDDKIYAFVSGDYNPQVIAEAPEAPNNLQLENSTEIKWDAVEGVRGYLVLIDKKVAAFTLQPNYSGAIDIDNHTYSVCAVGQNGNLSPTSNEIGTSTGVTDKELGESFNISLKDGVLYLPENLKCEVYSISGVLINRTISSTEINLQPLAKGVYCVKVIALDGNVYNRKISL